MSQDNPTLMDVRRRREMIDAAVANLEKRITAYRHEQQELLMAERILMRFSTGGIEDDIDLSLELDNPSGESVNATSAATKIVERAAKPDGIPTIPEMIFGALRESSSHGKYWLEPSEIRDYIRQRWWPMAHTNNIGPIVWKMGKDKKLKSHNGRYSLLGDDESPKIEEPSASKANGSYETGVMALEPPDLRGGQS
jgi:hypothetical protein